MNEWKEAVIDELVTLHLYSSEHDNNPRKAIKDAIEWNVKIALDQKVSSVAAIIAAAPDMLAACRKAILAIAHASESVPGLYDETYQALDAAIAKARGE